jgi:hypothetical protein
MARPSKQEIDDIRKAPKLEKAYNDAAQHTKSMYEESPYADRERDSDMRNKLNAMTNKAGAGRGFVNPPMKSMAKGGSASSRADGCAQRGKTRGKMC